MEGESNVISALVEKDHKNTMVSSDDVSLSIPGARVHEEADGDNQIVLSPIGHLSPIPVFNSRSFA